MSILSQAPEATNDRVGGDRNEATNDGWDDDDDDNWGSIETEPAQTVLYMYFNHYNQYTSDLP